VRIAQSSLYERGGKKKKEKKKTDKKLR